MPDRPAPRPRRRRDGQQPAPAAPPLPQVVGPMPHTPPGCPCFLVAVVRTVAGNSTGGESIGWLARRYERIGPARADAKGALAAGWASLAFVVAVSPDGTRSVAGVEPNAARRIVDHYENVWGLIEAPGDMPPAS